MRLPNIKKINFKGKRVLLRVGFDVPIKNGKISEDFRIKKGLPTIKFLREKGAKIIILNHLGQDGKTQKPVAGCLRHYFPKIKFIPRLFGKTTKKVISQMKNGDITIRLTKINRSKLRKISVKTEEKKKNRGTEKEEE